jgi:hypothetical protein
MSERDASFAGHRPQWSWRAVAAWLLVGLAGIAVLAYATAHSPRKPIGLLAVIFAVLAAWGLLWVAAELRLPGGRRLLAAVAMLVLVGQTAVALESHRAFAARLREHWGNDPAAWIRERIERQGVPDDQARAWDEASTEREQVLDQITSFVAWCRHRLSNHISFSIDSPWPRLIWIAEVLAGTALGVWLAGRIALATGTAPAKLED